MLNWLKFFFERKPIPTTGVIWNLWEHPSKNNHIYFSNFKKGEIRGSYLNFWLAEKEVKYIPINGLLIPNRPHKLSKGDELRAKMTSGRVGRFRIADIRYDKKQPEQFKGKVKEIGYLVAA